MDIEFTREDFGRLQRIRQINDKSFTDDKVYKNKEIKKKVKYLQRPVWHKMKSLRDMLLTEPYFYNRFDISQSHPQKQSNVPLGSLTRDLIWISLVDQTAYSKMDWVGRDRAKLPQLQISLQRKRLVIASVWLEGNHCDQVYREQFLNYFENYKLDKKYTIEIYDKNKEKRLTLSELPNVQENKNYSIGILRVLDEKDVIKLGDNIYSQIVNELQILNKKIFSSCFNYELKGKVGKVYKSKEQKRKSSAKFKIIEAVRKGKEKQTITYKQRQIQNDLLEFFDKKYKYPVAIAKLEEDFVDFKLEFPQKNVAILYEIKTSKSAISCIKNGLGQLMFYRLGDRLKKFNSVELVIVGLGKMDKAAKDFVKEIKSYIGKDVFRYQMFDEKKKVLLPESKS